MGWLSKLKNVILGQKAQDVVEEKVEKVEDTAKKVKKTTKKIKGLNPKARKKAKKK